MELRSVEEERLIQQRLREAQAEERARAEQQPVPCIQVWARSGNCPVCGAPIWFCAAAPATERPPQSYYSCACTQLQRMRAVEDVRRAVVAPNGELHP
jgi:hypothetical protein